MAPDDDRTASVNALTTTLRVLAIAALVVASAACSHGRSAAPAASGAVAAARGTRHEKGIPIALPARTTSSKDVDPVHDSGEEIYITDQGIKPKSLTAKVEAQLWIVNETDKTQQIRFLHPTMTLAAIPPHKKITYVSHETSVYYFELVSDPKVQGSVLFEPWYDPYDPNSPTFTPKPAS